jgi:SAM-dependent methyltransferase
MMLIGSSENLHDFQRAWDLKPVLRLVYADMFRRMMAELVSGPTLEIGGGIGNLKELMGNVWSSDIQYSERLDLVTDAQRLPFRSGSLSNIVMLDVLHHLQFPIHFLREAAYALRPGGRIVMIEPAITWGSSIFYRFLHREPVNMAADPLIEGTPTPGRDPYISNQAIPTLLATKHRNRFHKLVPQLRLQSVRWFSFIVYPLSGGFRRWCLIPTSAVARGLDIERRLEPIFGDILGFRVLMRIERREF